MISDIETIIESFGKGEMIILIDDEDRENEGDLVVAADHLSPEHINFMIKSRIVFFFIEFVYFQYIYKFFTIF